MDEGKKAVAQLDGDVLERVLDLRFAGSSSEWFVGASLLVRFDSRLLLVSCA